MIKARENSIRFWALLAVLILSGGIINAWERAGEARVSRKPLKEFPQQVGSWRQQGDDVVAVGEPLQHVRSERRRRGDGKFH